MKSALYRRASLICCLFLLAWVCPCPAQEGELTIRVESRLVIVPVMWGSWIYCSQTRNKDLLKCSWDGATNDQVSRDAYMNREFTGPDDLGLLSLKDLRIFEDGKEQNIVRIEKISRFNEAVGDNLGTHLEAALVPAGIWSTSDVAAVPSQYSKICCGYYQIAYSPQNTTEGSCHTIRITGPHESKLVYRKQYCFVTHSASDLLKGTQEDTKLEGYIAAGRQGSIRPRMQANAFSGAPGKARVDLDVEFPFDEVKPKDLKGWALPVEVLILAYGKDGQAIARHSELVPADRDILSNLSVALDWLSVSFTFVRYDAQIELLPGVYKLAFVYSHGPDFGIAEAPLTVDNYDGSQFSISTIALCKRVRSAGERPLAKDYVPLVAGSNEYTPAADTDFSNGDLLTAYFELYEPASGQPQPQLQVNYTMRIRNEQTGVVVLEKAENADSSIRPGKSTIPIAVELELSQLNLPPGKYQIEIQAADSAGKSTPLRTAQFWID
jgi:hypothetical protein